MYEADVVIAGGELDGDRLIRCNMLTKPAGTTGCVVAGRLAEARPDLRIVLIETGRDIAQDQRVASGFPRARTLRSIGLKADLPEPLDGLFSVYEGADQSRPIIIAFPFHRYTWWAC